MNFITKAFSSGFTSGRSIPYSFDDKIHSQNVSSNVFYSLFNSTKKDFSSTENHPNEYSIFEFNINDSEYASTGAASDNARYLSLIKNSALKLKTIKLPGIIKIHDFFEFDNSNNLFIVTERVTPLSDLFNKNANNSDNSNDTKTHLSIDELVFSINNLSNSLKFINNEASSVHGNIFPNSIYIDQSGVFKLFGFELLSNLNDSPNSPSFAFNTYNSNLIYKNYNLHDTSSNQNYKIILPPEITNNNFTNTNNKNFYLKIDSYLFGILILNLISYNSSSLSHQLNSLPINPSINQFSNLINSINLHYSKKFPSLFLNNLKGLLNPIQNSRLLISKFFQSNNNSPFFNSNLLISNHNNLNLLNIDLFNNLDLLYNYLNSLQNLIGSNKPTSDKNESVFLLQSRYIPYKLLPDLIHIFNLYNSSKSINQENDTIKPIILYYILYYSNYLKKINESYYQFLIAPFILLCFNSNNRLIRATLLTSLKFYINDLNKSDISNKVFNNLIKGFSDTNETIRNETLKSTLHILPTLSIKQINNDLLKYLAKLQNDNNLTIKINTILILEKISLFLIDDNKNTSQSTLTSFQNILIIAFNKSINDTSSNKFLIKISTLNSLKNCLLFFDPVICCSKILSLIAPLLLDNNHKIRNFANEIFNLYLNKINEKVKLLDQKDERLINEDKTLHNDYYELNGIKYVPGEFLELPPPVIDQDNLNNNEFNNNINDINIKKISNNNNINIGSNAMVDTNALNNNSDNGVYNITNGLSNFGFNLAVGAINKLTEKTINGELNRDLTPTPSDVHLSLSNPSKPNLSINSTTTNTKSNLNSNSNSNFNNKFDFNNHLNNDNTIKGDSNDKYDYDLDLDLDILDYNTTAITTHKHTNKDSDFNANLFSNNKTKSIVKQKDIVIDSTDLWGGFDDFLDEDVKSEGKSIRKPIFGSSLTRNKNNITFGSVNRKPIVSKKPSHSQFNEARSSNNSINSTNINTRKKGLQLKKTNKLQTKIQNDGWGDNW
ncbi:COPI-interacting protein CEX1 ASCRUDRAFT_9530 [Ascoidea rubescens DSM 1968]|uniref:Protein kinase domain-containing protein n=1 Tax=Ascoidea rubescens DSM 1968 TaxID=1344418 RepID=A0A1D2VCY5_9ASCO|nr:hypothetical protein ASCRUDRAFT_9530 [Ascoidea rubescens DSM 1968]ODV59491.1 hypothetical protein ASCRUDRAFT_9530 [Ascoidea rubescens DSM 1968]